MKTNRCGIFATWPWEVGWAVQHYIPGRLCWINPLLNPFPLSNGEILRLTLQAKSNGNSRAEILGMGLLKIPRLEDHPRDSVRSKERPCAMAPATFWGSVVAATRRNSAGGRAEGPWTHARVPASAPPYGETFPSMVRYELRNIKLMWRTI